MSTRTCTIADCLAVVECRNLCRKHYTRWRRHGDPLVMLGHGGTPAGVDAKDEVGYHAAHKRVRTRRGSARLHLCRCGSEAQEWAYLHTGVAERLDERGRPYSLNPEQYVPLCCACHRTFDGVGVRSG